MRVCGGTVPRGDCLSLSPFAPSPPAPATPEQRRQPRSSRDGAARPRGSGGTGPAEAVGEAWRGPDPAVELGQISSAATSPPGTAGTPAQRLPEGTGHIRSGGARAEPYLTCELSAWGTPGRAGREGGEREGVFSCASKINEIFRRDCGGRPPSSAGGSPGGCGGWKPRERGQGGGRERQSRGRGFGRLRLTAGRPRPGPCPTSPAAAPGPGRGGRRMAGRGLRPSGRAASPLPLAPSPPAGAAPRWRRPLLGLRLPFSRPVTGPYLGGAGRETQPCPSPNFLPSESAQPQLCPLVRMTSVLGLP